MYPEIDKFYSHPNLKLMHDSQDMDEKLRLAAEIHGGAIPWKGEPHRKQWKHAGFDCLIVRNGVGALCGYVGLPSSHPFHSIDYDEIYRRNSDLNVHGGLTYTNSCQGKICHESESDDHVWWLGFDCSHSGDWSPLMMKHSEQEAYRNIEYVTSETNRLAEQLLACSNGTIE